MKIEDGRLVMEAGPLARVRMDETPAGFVRMEVDDCAGRARALLTRGEARRLGAILMALGETE